MMHERILLLLIMLTFCSCLLTSIRILALKIFFWHGQSISLRPAWKNVFLNCLWKIFISCQTQSNFQFFFMSLSWDYGPQNNLFFKMKRLEIYLAMAGRGNSNTYYQGHHCNQCHLAMALVNFLISKNSKIIGLCLMKLSGMKLFY